MWIDRFITLGPGEYQPDASDLQLGFATRDTQRACALSEGRTITASHQPSFGYVFRTKNVTHWCSFWYLFIPATFGMNGGGGRRIVASARVKGGADAGVAGALSTRTRRSRTIAGRSSLHRCKCKPRLAGQAKRGFALGSPLVAERRE
jgi:hypothetical protein